ncbi:hypothetical protein EPUL_000788 [Erysiphe pulchra]|uniref:DDE-1 domain-containing protein n=1 Tax=Erysiphe pulchra TaxID=225359 RepID=A0A2S4PXG9_9PEZI|nr:hypothetical protein EPUL_000788 [Erysiphe pulchra]
MKRVQGLDFPLAEKVIVLSSIGELYTRSPEDWTFITLIETVNAAGGFILPFFMVPGEKTMSSWAHKKLDGESWMTNCPKGHITNEAMNEYLDHFIQYSNSGPIKPWTMLLLDGYTFLPSHETHDLQPLDVGVFRQWKHFQNKSILKALQELDYDYSISSFFCDVSGFRKEALKEMTIKSAFKKSGIWPISCKNTLLSRSRYVGQQGHDEIESEQPSQPTEFEHVNIRLETNYEAAMLIKEITWKTAHRSGRINVGQWKAKICEKERHENAKAIRKVERQIQIAANKAQKSLGTTGVQARNKKEYLKSCENSSLRPPSDLQQVLDLLIEEKELRWPLEGGSSDIEISLGTQYLDPVASPFDSECEGDDQDQGHLRADVE